MQEQPVIKVPPVHYTKSLENPQIYFLAFSFGMIIYWCEMRHDLVSLTILQTVSLSK